MAINTQYKPKIYISDGETRRLNFDFFIFKKENLKIKLITLEDQKTVELNYGYDYTLEAKYDYYDGGWVVLNDELKLTKGDKIILYRDTDQTQEINLLNLQTISPKNLTSMFDKVTALIQENKDEYYRSLKYDYEELSLVNQDKPLEEQNLRNLAVDNITKTVALTLSPDSETNQWLLTKSKLDPDRTLDVLKATEEEAITGTDDKKYITPNTLKTTTDNRLDNYTKETIITNTIFQYKAETNYSIGQPCYALLNNEPIFYYSIKDNNINNNPTEDTEGNYWKQLKFGGDGGNLPIGSIITSTIPITDANLHLADGAKIAYDGVYKEFYDYMQLKLKDKANVNIVGTLTNQNNILSGFSTTSYATLPEIFNPSNNTWEMAFKINVKTLNKKNTIFCGINSLKSGVLFRVANNNVIELYLSSNGSTWDIASGNKGTTILETNKDYYIKLAFTGTQYIVSLSTDNITENMEITVNSNISIINNTTIANTVGFDGSAIDNYFDGSIDLNKSYIKINNKYWWKGIIKDISDSNIFCTEEQYNNSITATGNCGKYVLMENEYIRLPTINGWIENITDINNNGTANEAGLPNITGTFQGTRSGASADYAAPSGAFRRITPGLDTYNTGGGDCYNTEFNASYSNSIYGKSTTVQPKGVKYLIYIVLGTVIKTDIEIDINQITNDINIVAGEASKNSNSILVINKDINTINTNINSINTKLNTATKNITALQKSYVIETYNNSGNWYRKYSDGWCEQGGKLANTGGADIMFNLLVPFKDTNYFIVKNCGSPHTDTPAYRSVSCYNLTTTTAMHTSNTTQVYARYYACGYYK